MMQEHNPPDCDIFSTIRRIVFLHWIVFLQKSRVPGWGAAWGIRINDDYFLTIISEAVRPSAVATWSRYVPAGSDVIDIT